MDSYVYGVMCANAGYKPAAKTLTASNIYTEILAASESLDNAETPETGRGLVVTPAVYVLMKKCKDIVIETDVGNDLWLRGCRLLYYVVWQGSRICANKSLIKGKKAGNITSQSPLFSLMFSL